MNTPREFKVKLSSDSNLQSINLPVDILKEVAEATGASTEGLEKQITFIIRKYLETKKLERTFNPKNKISLEEAGSPLREVFEKNGITEEELIKDFQETRDELYEKGVLK